MEQKLDLILNELRKLNDRVTTIENNMTTIENNMATKESVTDIPAIKVAVLETNADVKEIKNTVNKLEQIQINQQQIIDLLSVRSIQQEAELKRIK